MGKVLLTVKPFSEARIAEEIRNYVYVRFGVEVRVITTRYAGVLIVESDKMSSLELAKIVRGSAPIARLVRKVVPITLEVNVERADDVVRAVERAPVREALSTCRSFAVRCKFRGFRGEHAAEKRIGDVIKSLTGLSVNLRDPDCIVIVECIDRWCGVYMGRLSSDIVRIRV